MNFKLRLLGIAILGFLIFSPSPSFATSCPTASLNTLIGTTCSIGEVSFSFLTDSFSGMGVTANSILFTPNSSNPLAPDFVLSGPFSVTATGLGQTSTQFFSFFWMPKSLDPSFQITGATSLLIDPLVPKAPSFGFIAGGNNLGFTNATFQTGGPNVNPSTASISQSELHFPDAYFGFVSVEDGTGNGAKASVGGMEHQYNLALVPEPSSLLLLATSLVLLVAMVGLKPRNLLA
jgi:hypothetical protein